MKQYDWEFKYEIEKEVERIASSRVSRFYPTYIHKVTGYHLEDVFAYLLELVRDNRLKLLWEIRCPEYDCNAIIKRTDRIENYLHKTVECDECENNVFISESIVFPVFKINAEYRKKLQGIKKKEQNLVVTV